MKSQLHHPASHIYLERLSEALSSKSLPPIVCTICTFGTDGWSRVASVAVIYFVWPYDAFNDGCLPLLLQRMSIEEETVEVEEPFFEEFVATEPEEPVYIPL